ncbi:hypothetical protein BDW71DRAFT_127245 [Aspergillus fruticulosus]
MGLSPELLGIISCIIMLSRRRHTNAATTAQKFISLVRRLSYLEAPTSNSDTDEENSDKMTFLSSAFQTAIWIYLYHVFLPAAHTTVKSFETPTSALSSQLSHNTQASRTPAQIPYLMWALLIVMFLPPWLL